ncbi:translocation/assembly module TamB domain-containing protein [Pelomonas sp. Root1237]|uniref:translocation/assembly module TamB domain-containing protein n=1 Tax=Pelomonas sp. Root1237 TaxID=1736434 RepID=UPI0012F9DA9A|nr:translocation/assembly module TamB domain-containing protein [Pelomonas sp. Root1237]
MRRSLRILRAALIALALVLVLIAGFVAWLLQRPSGGAWLLAHLPGVQIEAPEGSLMGEFSARRLILTWAGGSAELRGLRWKGLGVSPSAGLLLARELAVDEVVIRSQASDKPIVLPPDLTLPLGVQIASLRIAKLSWAPDQAPLLGLDAQLDLPRRGTHRIELKAARWQHLTLAGKARIESAAPLQTDATLRVQQAEATDLPWSAVAAVTGPLARLKAKAELEAAHQTLKADGEVQPFAPWPVNALQLKADKLDLAALMPGLPRTALSGDAQLKAPARDAEATLQADLHNAAAGRWDQGALPVNRLVIALAGRPDQPTSLRLTALDAELPGGGRVQGKGAREADGRWQLDARVQGLRPEALDARATPARLDGPLTLAGSKAGPLSAKLDLAGTVQNRPLRVKAKARGEGTKWQIEDAQLASGDATLQASGRVDTAGAAQLKVQLRQFDPHLLWRGAPGTAWARLPSPTRLSAEADVDVRGKTLATLSGNVYARLLPSQFAGLPLEGRIKLQRERAADAAAFDIDGRLGNNRVQTSGQARAEAITGTAALKAGALAELNPLLALFDQQPIAGQGEGVGSFQLVRGIKGWQVGGSGKLSLASAKALGTSIAALKARWELPLPGADGDGPVALNLDISQLRDPLAQLNSAKLDLQGRRSAHDVKAEVSGKIIRDASARDSQDLTLNAQLQARGRWDGQAWSGRVARIAIGPLRPNTPPLLAAKDIGLRWASDGPRLQAEPGRAEVGGAFVRWQALSWTGGERPEARAELQLEDVAAAPLMARWQPDFGWGGDLRVTGHASLLLNDRLTAELLIERQSGDLRVTDEFGQRALGLTDLRLAVNVRDGLWQFAQGVAGSELGSLGGAVTLRPAKLWPDAQTPVQGVLQANIANLATWGSWVPAGWRLGGRAAATVQLSGRLGAPDLNGRAEGENLALRHLLFGVDVTEGRFTLDLKGQHAELSKLEARGGDGWLRASGTAELGAQPKAHIEMTADKLRVLSRVDRRLVASGQAALDLDAKGLKLEGKLRADEGLFDFSRGDAPALADDVTVLRGPRDAAPTAPPAPKAARNSVVNVALDFGRDFKVRGRGLATTLRGQLQVSQNNGPLRVTGKLDADGGQYAAYGQKLDIERGDISFTGAYDNPSLDLLAVRPNLDVRVGVYVGGTALAPRVSLYSSPEMSDTDKLSWLLLGRGPDGLGRTDTALLQRAALALLSGEGEGPTGKVLRNLGLDELSLSQSDDDTKATIVRLGKQISRRWYVGYERGLNATTGSWQLIYRIAQRFTLRAQGGDDNALDLIWQWKWD